MKLFLSFSLFISLFASCNEITKAQQEENIQQVTKEQLEQQLTAIETFIDKGSCNGGAQCQYLPYGSKPCGGPRGYLIFSENVDVDQLTKMVDAYTKSEAAYNEQNQLMSDCSIPAEPVKLGCENGDCVRIQ